MLRRHAKRAPVSAPTQNAVEALDAMARSMRNAPPLYAPSIFWQELEAIHLEELHSDGFENFKRTLNMRYFNWTVGGILYFQLAPVLRQWLGAPSFEPFAAGFDDYRAVPGSMARSFNPLSALLYKVFVAMFADVVRRDDPLGLMDRLTEPEVGHPFVIRHRGHAISQDLCNSIHEFYSATVDSDRTQPGTRVAELGAGYGRLGQVFLSALPGSSYTVIDIPPALYVSQRYLGEVFSDRKIFAFRDFQTFDEVREEFESSQIRFLAAHQIEMLPDDSFDLFVNISSLHEMTYEQIVNYLGQIDRICRGRFYSKQWKTSRGQQTNGFTIRASEYPIPPRWTEVFHRSHPIQAKFFEALYRT